LLEVREITQTCQGKHEREKESQSSFFVILPLIHVMFGVIQPHPYLDGIPLPNPMKDILHFGWISSYNNN